MSRTTRDRLIRLHLAGLIAGAFSMAMALTGVGVALGAAELPAGVPLGWILAVVSAAWAAQHAFGFGLPFPRSRWQVPDMWRHRYPPSFTALAYGYLLGLGFLTDVVAPTFWILVGLTIGIANPLVALIAWTVYASVRAYTTFREIEANPTPERPATRPFPAALRIANVSALLAAAVLSIDALSLS